MSSEGRLRESRPPGLLREFVWVSVVVVVLLGQVHAEVLTPPYFNLAERRRITATDTCGEDTQGPELFCKLVGANADRDENINVIQGQVCDYCDPQDPVKKHPAEFAVDGAETWWQSPPLSRGVKYNEVNLTIDLGQEFHVAYVFIKMANAPRPAVWVLERSTDNGRTYKPWQYFADSPSECEARFGPETLLPITRDDQVICEMEYSKIVPLEGGEIVVSFLNKRPSANDFFNSTILQEFTRATNVRLVFMRTKTLLGHLMSVARQDPTVTRRYFYSIKDISIGGRCVCNGHAENCDIPDPEDAYKLWCRCKHNTCGTNCEMCCPGFEQKRWRQSKHYELFQCEPCNCFGHSDKCKYDPEVDEKGLSIDMHGNHEGGGVCLNCQHNTDGINCNSCKPKYYRPYDKLRNATDACQPCVCDDRFHTGNCADGRGICECKANFTSPDCKECNFGYYGFPECKECDCFGNGTIDPIACQTEDGKCSCKPSYAGKFCRECSESYFGYPNCTACDCNKVGSNSLICANGTGQCPCLNNFGGRKCDQCADGYHGYPDCIFCRCDARGTLPGVCDKGSGRCQCREGYDGERCDTCSPGYHGYPNCRPCNCSVIGSVSTRCDATGKCPCLGNFASRSCDQCRSGFYKFPECLQCNCDPHGSVGVGCDSNGHCQCKENFAGARCDDCKEGLYNFPICEECNCDPAGVMAGFTGCGTLPAGELCLCKSRVEGRICNVCKPTFWNLQMHHRDGCEECDCHLPGVLGGINVCDSKTGQCLCKPSVGSQRCDSCKDGSYKLLEESLFGCRDCGCDIGGSVNSVCDKATGQCTCHPRIVGRTCNEPIETHYFPTLYHIQFEAEDGFTNTEEPIRYGFEEDVFHNFSSKGYVVFSTLQNKIHYSVKIEKPSLYRMVLRYINPGPETTVGHITVIPESNAESEQHFQVVFKPTNGTPSFVTVSGLTNSIPSPLVMDPGSYTVVITNKSYQRLLLDYFALLPAAYYEASILVKPVTEPCTIGNQTLCQQYHYPKVSSCDVVRGETALVDESDSRVAIREYYQNQKHLDEVGRVRVAMLSSTQPELHLDITVTEIGKHYLLIEYITPPEVNHTTHVILEIPGEGSNPVQGGRAVLHLCPFTTTCRQAIIDEAGRVIPFNLKSNYVKLSLKADGPTNVAIDCVIAIPMEDWSLDYIQPKPLCVRQDGKCLPANFRVPPDSKKIELETDNADRVATKRPPMISDNSSGLIFLDFSNPSIDVEGRVPRPGPYVFIVHYFQPDHPEFKLNTVIQNGQYYEGVLPIRHCPSISGCRSVIQQQDGTSRTMLTDTFILTLKQPTRFGVWIDYLLVVPVEQFSDSMLHQEDLDQTKAFIKQCGQNHFYLSPKTEGFCKEAVFSLTSAYNSGALRCNCDYQGSTSFKCEMFGGQCPCKPNVIGRQCTRCKTNYSQFPDCIPCDCPKSAQCDQITGKCKCAHKIRGEKCDECEVNTYGYDSQFGCFECNCSPQGVVDNNLQCGLEYGNCSCKPNIVGRQCDKCLEGYWDFPLCQKCDCDLRGSKAEICAQDTAQCYCKANIEGEACDVCVDGTFDIQAENPEGCTKCFCFGKTSRCSSAALFRTQITGMDGWNLAAITYQPAVVVTPLEIRPEPANQEGIVADLTNSEAMDRVVYFKAPDLYYNNMLTSYGGNLNYTIFYTTGLLETFVSGPDVILHGSATDQYLLHLSEAQPAAAIKFNNSVRMIEDRFILSNGLKVSRDVLMQTLKSLDAMYIKATYSETSVTSRLLSVSFDTAQKEYNPDYGLAHAVEQCLCPPGYKGLSCEECAPGYYRTEAGPYGGFCVPCQCNGHSDVCDPVSGICMNCQLNTTGDHCEECATGYHGDATGGSPFDCLICACPLPITSNNFATGCLVSPDGDSISCDCKDGYFGARCESCAAGYYGRPENQGDYCKPCICNNNIDPHDSNSCDSVTGECMTCLNNTFGVSCQYCAPGFYGDAITRKDCQSCVCSQCGTAQCNNFSGICECLPNVVGEKCDTCAPDHFGFGTCKGCNPCDCGLASESTQCDDKTGQCRCKPGVTGRTCDKCKPGYWNYGPDGCISCGCNTNYSVGVGCNAATGQCSCLPGVIGEKCDHCPYRWVLKNDEGCFECDACTHGLLNDTDELDAMTAPQRADFETAAASHFTHQRLLYINDTANNLAPAVKSIVRVDLKPITSSVSDLDHDADQLIRNGAYKVESAEKTAPTGNIVRQSALDLESDMAEAGDKAVATVQEINNITFSLEAGSGPQIDYSISVGERLLAEILQEDLSDPDQEARRVLAKAEQLKEAMGRHVEPVANHTRLLGELQKQLNEFDRKLVDLRNNSDSALKGSIKTEELNHQNQYSKVLKKMDSVKNLAEETERTLDEAKQHLNDTATLVVDAKKDFSDIEYEATRVVAAKNRLNDSLNEETVKLSELIDSVKGAEVHAELLSDKVKELDQNFSHSRNTSHYALGAANAYVVIVNATQEAMAAAQAAHEAAQNATKLSAGVENNTNLSERRSMELLQTARDRLFQAQTQLAPPLKSAAETVASVNQLTGDSSQALGNIERDLDNIPILPLSVTTDEATEKSEKSQESVQDAIAGITDILTMLPEQSQMAKKVPQDFGDARNAIIQAENQLKTFPTVATFEDKVDSLDVMNGKQKSVVDTARDDIAGLKRKVAEARETTNRIKVGVRFYPNTTLQLKNPDSLSQQTTSSRISVYFKTEQPNGFVLYLGNEKDTNRKLRRTKTDDYLAFVIENGYPVMTVDLGNKPQRVIVNKVVSDNQWYQAIIERTGKSARLTIREEGRDGEELIHTKEDVINGTNSILNLDPEHSKLFVGGYPNSFKIQDEIKESSFDGEMQDLVVGDTPVSLWNFVDAVNNRNGSSRRKQLVNLTPNTGYRFTGSGHVALDARSYLEKERSAVQFRFKTKSRNGLLFLIGSQEQYLSVELRDGRLLYQFDLGDGPVPILSPDGYKYNDGRWHSVEAGRDRNKGLLKIDGEEAAKAQSSGLNEDLIPPAEIYFGGYPGDHAYQSKGVTNIDFDGCIDHVQIDSASVDLSKNIRATGVSPGCPPKFVGLVSFSERAPGYLRWPRVNTHDELQLNLRFKTSSSPGLIAYITDEDQTATLSLSMVDGTLVLRSKTSDVTSHPTQYNDGQWHVVTATYSRNGLQLDVDDFEMFKTPNPGYPLQIQDGSLYFGGLPREYNLVSGASASANSFTGCLADATIGGVLINFANVTERQNVIFNKCPSGSDSLGYPDPIPDDEDEATPRQTDSEDSDPGVELRPSSTVPTPATPPPPAPIIPPGQCALPFSPASDPDVSEESGSRFGSKPFSRFEFGSLPLHPRKRYEFSLDFKTVHPNGTIFFVSDKNYVDHIAVYLINGQVHYSFNCGSGAALLVSKESYDDGEWHTVVFSRKDTSGQLIVDEVLVASGESSGNTKTLNVIPPFYLGSLSEASFAGLKEKNTSISVLSNLPGFTGCLRSIKMNKGPVTNRTLSQGTLACSDKIEKGFFFGPNSGYIKALDKFRVGFDIDLSLDVKPRHTSGILVAVQGTKDYLLLQMVNGTIKFTVDNGQGPITVSFEPVQPQDVCDGEWIKIQAVKSKNVVTLGVNEVFGEPFIGSQGSDATDTRHPLYVGGHPNPRELRGAETTEQFVGCIRNLLITRDNKNVIPSLSAARSYGEVISNVCPTI